MSPGAQTFVRATLIHRNVNHGGVRKEAGGPYAARSNFCPRGFIAGDKNADIGCYIDHRAVIRIDERIVGRNVRKIATDVGPARTETRCPPNFAASTGETLDHGDRCATRSVVWIDGDAVDGIADRIDRVSDIGPGGGSRARSASVLGYKDATVKVSSETCTGVDNLRPSRGFRSTRSNRGDGVIAAGARRIERGVEFVTQCVSDGVARPTGCGVRATPDSTRANDHLGLILWVEDKWRVEAGAGVIAIGGRRTTLDVNDQILPLRASHPSSRASLDSDAGVRAVPV